MKSKSHVKLSLVFIFALLLMTSGVRAVTSSSEITSNPLGNSGPSGPLADQVYQPEDYQKIYEQASSMLKIGTNFEQREIQLEPAGEQYGTVITDVMKNYADFNNGALYKKFCVDYEDIDENNMCRETSPESWPTAEKEIRNQLVSARELFGILAVAEPANLLIRTSDCTEPCQPIQDVGREGVLAATREIAKVHLIFGNEFLVDALDYRFSGSILDADLIIAEEIDQLKKAQLQFSLAADVLAFALNTTLGGTGDVRAADYFTEQDFELFSIASERLVMSMNELALRYRQLGQDQEALKTFTTAYRNQYMQSLALAHKAAEQNIDFLNHGGWQLMTNLEQLRAQAQAIESGINPLGYPDAYVPLQSYEELSTKTRSIFLADAEADENAALNAQREFDHNKTALINELQRLRESYDRELGELCGPDIETCEEGQMRQNKIRWQTAVLRVQGVEQRINAIPERMAIEQERAGKVISITLESGKKMSATDYTIALKNSFSVGDSTSTSTGTSESQGISVSASVGYPSGASVSVGYNESTSTSNSTTQGTSKSWNPYREEIADLTSLKTMRQATERAEIENANSQAAIRTLLLEEADLLIELDIAVSDLQGIEAEHNQLVYRYQNLLNLRQQAKADLLDSYLNNPAFRILRDHWTVEASRSFTAAAHFAYLTAKALEYRQLARVPFISNIYKARTVDEIETFLNDLEELKIGFEIPRDQFVYEISVAKDILGLSDENLQPYVEREHQAGHTDVTVEDLRFEQFQRFLKEHTGKCSETEQPCVEFHFSTTLSGGILEPDIWNNRIAGIGEPLAKSNGVAMNIITKQIGNVGTPRIRLEHGGHASYRTSKHNIVEYDPENARRPGLLRSPDLAEIPISALINTSVNDNQKGNSVQRFKDFSSATSNWTLSIDLTSPANKKLKIDQIEDIEIILDTYGFSF